MYLCPEECLEDASPVKNATPRKDYPQTPSATTPSVFPPAKPQPVEGETIATSLLLLTTFKASCFLKSQTKVYIKCFSWISASGNIVYKRIESCVQAIHLQNSATSFIFVMIIKAVYLLTV